MASPNFLPLSRISPVPMVAPSYAVEVDGEIYLPVLAVANPGHGEGGRFLDSLPRDRTVKIPGVINEVLAGMLARRGFTVENEWSGAFNEEVEVYVRRA